MTWIHWLGWFLIVIIGLGVVLLVVGIEKPGDETEETYKTYKWVGAGILIFAGVAGLVWFWLWRRNKKLEDFRRYWNSLRVYEPQVYEPQILNNNDVLRITNNIDKMAYNGDRNAMYLQDNFKDYRFNPLYESQEETSESAIYRNIRYPENRYLYRPYM